MNTPRHMAVGAVAAAAPDAVLLAFIWWHREWLPPTHPAVRAHRWLHDSPYSVCVPLALGWASHLVTDRMSTHRTGPTG